MPTDLAALSSLHDELTAHHATLVAVSKTKPAEDIRAALNAGQLDFGENYTRELVSKAEFLPKEIRWHFIGHLQRNKVKDIISFVHLIHGVDSERLLEEISKQAVKNNLTANVLLQIHIAEEETKFGLSGEEAKEIMSKYLHNHFHGVHIKGLMGMATFTDNTEIVRREFRGLKKLFEELKNLFPPDKTSSFNTLSMGMSADYKIALEEGSTMVRVGSMIFGDR
jgi:PLP dependent protein